MNIYFSRMNSNAPNKAPLSTNLAVLMSLWGHLFIKPYAIILLMLQTRWEECIIKTLEVLNLRQVLTETVLNEKYPSQHQFQVATLPTK